MRYLLVILMLVTMVGMGSGSENAFSISMRECVIDTLPFDYEFRYRVENDTSRLILLYEREVGLNGWGAECNMPIPAKIEVNDQELETEFDWYMREVKGMNYQSVDLTWPSQLGPWKLKAGFSANMDYWKYPRLLLSVNLKAGKVFRMSMRTNFDDREIASIYIGKKLTIPGRVKTKDGERVLVLSGGKDMFVSPFFEYKIVNGETDWWFKTEVGVEFK